VEKLLVGNKCDLAARRVVTYDQGKQLADSIGCKFVEVRCLIGKAPTDTRLVQTSALSSINVDEAFMTLAKTIKQRGAAGGPARPSVLRATPQASQGGCCG
jgi:Ras-related protein Rab-1A